MSFDFSIERPFDYVLTVLIVLFFLQQLFDCDIFILVAGRG